jgi:hypothetical protein
MLGYSSWPTLLNQVRRTSMSALSDKRWRQSATSDPSHTAARAALSSTSKDSPTLSGWLDTLFVVSAISILPVDTTLRCACWSEGLTASL